MNRGAGGTIEGARLHVMRVLVHTLGRTSTGIRLCLDHGLTSGKMLDYVYRNTPSGWGPLGRAIDRAFLESKGWQAIRERRRLLEAHIESAIRALRAARRRISIVDVASGPAGYLLAVLQRVGETDILARARDLDERWLTEGRAEAERLGLCHVVFERGDALDHNSILAIDPRPNLAIASGFYDWITGDGVVRRSMAIVHEALEPGGHFVLTSQMAHPDLAMVSAVFPDFDGQPLRMKMRSRDLVHGWLEQMGFVIEESNADGRGYYQVTRARKPSSH